MVALVGLVAMPMTGLGTAAGTALVAICTDTGGQHIVLDANGNPVPVQSGSHGGGCPFCTAHAGYTLPPPASLMLVLPVGLGPSDRFSADAAFYPEQHFLIGRQTRAPPVATA
jgi:hypothetical protein